jgi:hypothetical protein
MEGPLSTPKEFKTKVPQGCGLVPPLYAWGILRPTHGVDVALRLFDYYTALFSWDAKTDIAVNVNTYMHAAPIIRVED